MGGVAFAGRHPDRRRAPQLPRRPGEAALREPAAGHPHPDLDLPAGGLLVAPGGRGGGAEAPNPTAREFGRAIVEARLGRQVVAALQGITTRTQSQDFEWAVMAIEIQREVGGNLAEVLQTVSETMRQRNRLKGEIRALTAEGRISAIVLGILPFAMGGFLWASNPEYIGTLFETTFGIVALIAGGLLMIGGGIWLRKIVNIEV